MCGIGIGLDPQLIAQSEAAVIVSLADDGPACKGGLNVGDVIQRIDDLDVDDLMRKFHQMKMNNNVMGNTSAASTLASALLGPEGTTVQITVTRTIDRKITKLTFVVPRGFLNKTSQWISPNKSR
ncbi:hypothetical protein GUITHDRAFT_118676 [Guillardia theta CCMP2712]|uniref:PDZ domain-containing protein n=1 Tax=Guillardia theta (strain CCMP2712) TaxID=905079 RepID=L1IFU0_GUITC|nr:hypothetical protein GUITHDRAFT_118676 [Guillardia theta CCMP2712]EKX35131.1 hypothetical protein GUITHDRAFT_118676 [Guillardia theta CCMP2712]|eukprot:XP_005822111.1 hypothetical protein GUITHDRAFT_118676 [Guillardia theta CCMP2712]